MTSVLPGEVGAVVGDQRSIRIDVTRRISPSVDQHADSLELDEEPAGANRGELMARPRSGSMLHAIVLRSS